MRSRSRSAAGGEAVALSTDVTSTEQCKALISAGVDAFGRIDGLVNSAYAHGDWAPADVSDPDKMGDVINVICQARCAWRRPVHPTCKLWVAVLLLTSPRCQR